MFYGKLIRTTIPKILSVSLLTTKEHPYKVKKKSARQFFHNLRKTQKLTFSFFNFKSPLRTSDKFFFCVESSLLNTT